jgi:replication-associated recombination protein RarA
MDSMPEEYAYFWRRLCVIACEDVGPADDVLASFVVACATVFPPKRTAGANDGTIATRSGFVRPP